MNRRGWVLVEALELCCVLTERFKSYGFAIALTGSVLTELQSDKDLDLVVFPLSSHDRDLQLLRSGLQQFGMKLLVGRESVQARWRRLGSKDQKHVEVWDYRGRRIDLFFLQ